MFQSLARFFRSRNDLGPGDIRPRVKVHDDHIRSFPVTDHRAPGMNFQYRGLEQADQTIQIIDAHIWVLILRILRQGDAPVHALPDVFLEEMPSIDTVGAAHEGERPSDDEGSHMASNLCVVIRKPCLGNAFVRPVETIAMGQGDAASRGLFR